MKEIKMVKYTEDQINELLALFAEIASDTKAFGCSLPMISVILNIDNYLRNNAVQFTEEAEDNKEEAVAESGEIDEENSEEEIIISGGGAE